MGDTLPTDHMPIVPTDHMLSPPDGDMERDLLMLKPRLTQLSSTPVLSQLFTPSSAPHSSTQLDPQSTMERERPRLIQLSSTPTLSQLSTLLSEPTLLSDPHLSTTHMPSPLPRPLTTVLSE